MTAIWNFLLHFASILQESKVIFRQKLFFIDQSITRKCGALSLNTIAGLNVPTSTDEILCLSMPITNLFGAERQRQACNYDARHGRLVNLKLGDWQTRVQTRLPDPADTVWASTKSWPWNELNIPSFYVLTDFILRALLSFQLNLR